MHCKEDIVSSPVYTCLKSTGYKYCSLFTICKCCSCNFESVYLSRTLLASCDRDVVEFMHQLDVLITAKQTQWERKEVALRDLLQTRERDLSGLRLALQEREKEVCACATEMEGEGLCIVR